MFDSYVSEVKSECPKESMLRDIKKAFIFVLRNLMGKDERFTRIATIAVLCYKNSNNCNFILQKLYLVITKRSVFRPFCCR